jgi:hypothetical protein
MCEHRPYLDAPSPTEEPKMLALSSRSLRWVGIAIATSIGALILAAGATHASGQTNPVPVKADISWQSVHPLV